MLAFVIATAKETSVGGTSRSSNEPDIESLPPIDGSPSLICASIAPRSAAAGLPQRTGTSWSLSKYSWNVSLAVSGFAPMARSFDVLSTTAYAEPWNGLHLDAPGI